MAFGAVSLALSVIVLNTLAVEIVISVSAQT
jgi:hypothetical protein